MQLFRVHIVAFLVVVLLGACSKEDLQEATFYPMGGIPFTVKAYGVPKSLFEEGMTEIRAEVDHLESILSSHIADSEVTTLNRERRAEISPETLQVMEMAARISADTEGAFDITVGPILDLWKFSEEQGRMPTQEEIDQRIKSVDWRQVALSSRGTATLELNNMSVDLGGIAKGFIADRAAQILKKKGIRRGIVDAGGDLVLFNSVGEEPFKVGVKNPLNPDELFGVLSLDSGAIVTSGCYERQYRIGDKRICHIIDPRTGQPASELESVTVVAEEAATADALATAAMVLGREKGMELIKSHPGAEALLIWTAEGKLAWELTPGLEGKLKVK